MLIKCPECELQVSDKALSCPHCGYPMKPNSVSTYRRRSNKRKRLPNGFGQITEIKGRNLRNPFRAMVTVGKTDTGKPICKPLKPQAFFPTYNDAYAALLEYNRNPYGPDSDITIGELYERWFSNYKEKERAKSTVRGVVSTWKHCSVIETMKVVDAKPWNIRDCIENSTIIKNGLETKNSPVVQNMMKQLFNMIFDKAVGDGLIESNPSRNIHFNKEIISKANRTKNPHRSFTDEEMKKLWDNVDALEDIEIILIQCYGGWRPQELGLIELKNVFLEDGYIIGGIKTKAGADRVVPIHPRIRPFIEKKYKEASELKSSYLINAKESKLAGFLLTYSKYNYLFFKTMKSLSIQDHRPHDCRKHFITIAKKHEIDEYALKYIIGHEIKDLTERVYTDRNTNWLIEEMQKIKE